jgi:hypothetical protein
VFGPFYRADPPDIVRKIMASGELWGRPPRNCFRSDTPKAKAYAGRLPEGVIGLEFETDAKPDAGGVPDQPTWSHKYKKRPDVVVEDDYAKIRVKVLKIQLD